MINKVTFPVIFCQITLIILLFLTSCANKKTVTEYITVHDTLTTFHTDTIRDVIYKTKTDTIRETIVREITIRQDSTGKRDTIRINTVNDHYRYEYVVDSTSSYRSAVDSILNAIHQSKEKETIKEKTPWYIRFERPLFLLAVVFLLCIYILKSKTDK